MKFILRRFILCSLGIWIFLGICPLIVRHFSSNLSLAAPEPASTPVPDISDPVTSKDSFRILDESTGDLLIVSDADFLPCALLCEMSPDAPEEALKAQIIAIYSTYSRLRQQNAEQDADFTCNTDARSVYAPPEILQEQYGENWEDILARVNTLCEAVFPLRLYYEDELVTAPFFAVSAGCTQAYDEVWGGEPLPYLQSTACPSDLLFDGCQAKVMFTPEEIQAAFPEIPLSGEPKDWFSMPERFNSGYVKSISLCGNVLSGTQVRSALSLRSASFTITYDGEQFIITTLGWGHGVGMSQAGAIYMAENSAEHTEILSYFYPNTELR